MSNLIDSISNAAALAKSPSAKIKTALSRSYPLGRPDSITAERIEVGLILNTMLGATAALDYLARQSVSPKVARRVLSESGRRRRHDAIAKVG